MYSYSNLNLIIGKFGYKEMFHKSRAVKFHTKKVIKGWSSICVQPLKFNNDVFFYFSLALKKVLPNNNMAYILFHDS